ncbi:hypothetical protein RSOLAG1IB_04966 [Rhizoctonia solani AG-1 IB]|uniref:Cryptic loci regulator 2 N-terminal domain-containing protein n=1 Tax=Thanatephorus cucumeris (strain AG1-IB / isolate 7/3/14) TaxID=1108050 RepID=A0A0B7FY33_THACB|nr:hypothetical protein RSOLAG1IB_04966 [Rhizoctonia solani AG-1 IB]
MSHQSKMNPASATQSKSVPHYLQSLVTGHFISWATSDASHPPTRPQDLQHRTSTEYYEEVLEDSKALNNYLEQLGTYIAETVYGYTDGPYFMDGLPDGYKLYRHHSKPKTTKKPRTDLYLYGPKGKPFRSCNEFMMHGVWLMGGGPQNPELCKCKYCGTVDSQILINKVHRLPGIRQVKKGTTHHHSG